VEPQSQSKNQNGAMLEGAAQAKCKRRIQRAVEHTLPEPSENTALLSFEWTSIKAPWHFFY
jgi:hypothetical protein